ncbi:MAG TPA: hypothetical protein VMV29_11905 [Ktedonobacterales bacterium]|nr:hypothetical protein [Ktedonobacterales bacterium]
MNEPESIEDVDIGGDAQEEGKAQEWAGGGNNQQGLLNAPMTTFAHHANHVVLPVR